MRTADPMIVDTAQRLFERLGAQAVAKPVPGAPPAAKAWQALAETGLDRMLVPESAGGVGAQLVDAVAVAHLAGFHAVPVPVVETIVAWHVLALAGAPEREGLVVLADASAAPRDGRVDLVVPWGREASHAVYLAGSEGAPRALAVEVPAASLEMAENVADEPRDVMRAASGKELGPVAIGALDLRALAALLRAAQMAGAMERILDIGIEHANTRVQFGRPIGQFQAVQHMLTRIAGQAASARAALDGGTTLMQEQSSWLGGALAKARASEATAVVNAAAHQVTAAMGFTREFPLQRYSRRLWAWRDEYGTEHEWHERIGAKFAAAGSAGAWPFVVEPAAG